MSSGSEVTKLNFAERLRAAGLSQTEFRRVVYRLTGLDQPDSTMARWINGTRSPPPSALALLELISHIPPRQLACILMEYPEHASSAPPPVSELTSPEDPSPEE